MTDTEDVGDSAARSRERQSDSDDYDFDFGKTVDDDYIDVEKRRADLSDDGEDVDEPREHHPSTDGAPRDVNVSHIIHDGSGSGASNGLDELIDEQAVIENDGRSETRTFFYPNEASDEQQQQFERLIRWQDGEGDSQRDVENRKADQRRYVDTFCGYVGASSRVRERVKEICESVNMSHMAYFNSQKIVLAAISLVANEDGWFIRHDERYRDLMTELGLDTSQLKTARQLLRKQSELV
jgi:hypothetical protein